MRADRGAAATAVFDIGGTWFRWGVFDPSRGLRDCQRVPAISYLSHPHLNAEELQGALIDFLIERTRELCSNSTAPVRDASVSLGAPINAHDLRVLGSGPLWGPDARPFDLHARLCAEMPGLTWHLLNDVSALLSCYMEDEAGHRKTMLITVSTGIGSRLYDHRAARIPYDATHGVQGEIGHLTCDFELNGRRMNRRCECGGWNHLNAFSSGRGLSQTLRELDEHPDASELERLSRLRQQLDAGEERALALLDASVTPLSRVIATTLCVDPDIDRVVITGGVARGLGSHYRESLQRTFLRDGLYQITHRDPHYLARRLTWDDGDDFAGLRGAGRHAVRAMDLRDASRPRMVS